MPWSPFEKLAWRYGLKLERAYALLSRHQVGHQTIERIQNDKLIESEIRFLCCIALPSLKAELDKSKPGPASLWSRVEHEGKERHEQFATTREALDRARGLRQAGNSTPLTIQDEGYNEEWNDNEIAAWINRAIEMEKPEKP